jgi:autotransporter-associated beta strand protein/uncharacterized repeat protein (TIGR03803 family)
MKYVRGIVLTAAVAMGQILVTGISLGNAVEVLHSFRGGDGGYGTQTGLTLVGSTLYGTTPYGGMNGAGDVFSLNLDGSGYQVLHSFNYCPNFGIIGFSPFFVQGTPTGEAPLAAPTLVGSKLYGTTVQGTSGAGSVYSMNLDGSGYQELHTFLPLGGATMAPVTPLTAVGSKLYGETYAGFGAFDGRIFAMNLDGTGYQDLHDLSDGASAGALMLIGTKLYGTTYSTVYSINLDGSGYQLLHASSGLDGHNQFGGLTLVGSKLYGTAAGGGANDGGAVFSLNLDGSGYNVLHSFEFSSGVGGFYPKTGLTLVGSSLYGTTWSDQLHETGTIFSLNLDGSGYHETHTFGPFLYDDDGNLIGNSDGAQPLGNLLRVGSTLYGTTSGFGPLGGGTVYSISTPATWIGGSSTKWADAANWSTAVPGANNVTINKDTAIFSQASPNSPLVIDAGRNLQNINFDTSAVNSLTIGTTSGPVLLLTAGGMIQTTSTVTNPQTINAPLVLEGDYAFSSGAASNLATLNFGGVINPGPMSGTTTLTLGGSNAGANTVSGALVDNGAGHLAVSKSGSGVWILSAANSYSGATTVSAGTLRFNIASGAPTIAAGATATVASGATLELAGSISALGAAGGNRVDVTNSSAAPGILVTGTHQFVGNIDGTGITQVNAGSDLTANHIIQSALIIGGAAGSPAVVTIDASDSSGNSLTSRMTEALTSADQSGVSDNLGSSAMNDGGSGALLGLADTSTSPGGQISVPEPSSFLLVAVGTVALLLRRIGRRTVRTGEE